MALGKQFENTYWSEDPESSEVSASLVRRTPDVEVDLSRPLSEQNIRSYELASTFTPTIRHGLSTEAESPNNLDSAIQGVFGERQEIPGHTVTTESGRVGYQRAQRARVAEAVPPIQGMLFNPYVATGLRQDPLVPEGAREDAARRALGMETTPEALEAYKTRAATFKTIGDKAAQQHQQLAVDSLTQSHMPLSEIERMAEMGTATTTVKPTGGRAFFDSGGATGVKGIVVNRDTAKVRNVTTVPERTETITAPSAPIPNPKFWSWYDKNAPTSGTMGFFEDVIDQARKGKDSLVQWSNPETGESIDLNDLDALRQHPAFAPSDTDSDIVARSKRDAFRTFESDDRGPYTGIAYASEVLNLLREGGFVPNIYGGKSRPSKTLTHTKDIPLLGDFSQRTGGDYNTINVHTRHEPEIIEERTHPAEEVVKYENHPVISGGSRTLVHEMGHAKDTERLRGGDQHHHLGAIPAYNKYGDYAGRYGFADPIAEGAADGYADRYGGQGQTSFTGPDVLESALSDPAFSYAKFKDTGYGTEYSGFKTNAHRALYSAIRAHVGSGGDFEAIPDRSALVGDPTFGGDARFSVDRDTSTNRRVEESHRVSEAALGHVWETMPHVHGHLKALGYDRIARTAAQENQRWREAHAAANAAEEPEQLQFDI